MEATHELVIIGGGVAGSAAALRAGQYGLRAAWVRGDKATRKRSRAQWVANIDNMIGVSDGIVRRKLLAELAGADFEPAREKLAGGHAHIGTRDLVEDVLERLAELPSVEVVEQAATGLSLQPGGFEVAVGERSVSAPAVVLATGVMDRQPSVAKQRGSELIDDPRWIYPYANRETVLYCIRCEGHLTVASKVAILGHAPSAAELAMMLHERYASACCLLTNGQQPTYGERSARLLSVYGIQVHTARIVDVERRSAGKHGELGGFVLADGSRVEVNFALVSLGLYRAYNELARAVGAELADTSRPVEERHVLVDARAETSVPGLFTIGDLAQRADEPIMKQIYTAQEYAVRAVDTVDRRRREALRARALAGWVGESRES